MTDFPWTDEQIATMRALTDEGFSASVIGEKMGITKGAVIGKKHRLGMCKPYSKPVVKPHQDRPVLKDKTPIFGKPVTLLALHAVQCKAVVRPRKYCGQPLFRRSFCSGHFKLYYMPQQKAKNRPKVYAA